MIMHLNFQPYKRVPIDLAIKRGLYDNKLRDVLDGNNEDVKGFFDPNTEENLNYSELVERCVTDAETGKEFDFLRFKMIS